ncbi:diacylglycerol/lipid kinase family protein [Chloroflexota bacterium]
MFNQCARAIVNPAAGGHSMYGKWPDINRRLVSNGLSVDCVYTEGVGHAIELAREAANIDFRYLIAVGGDGTVNEVVNGILDSNNPHNTILGIVSAGTTCSFARSLGIPLQPMTSSGLLTSKKRLIIDVGMVEYRNEDKHLRRYFINEADIGFGATVVEASKRIPNYFGRGINYIPYVLGGFSSLFSYKNKSISIRVEDEKEVSCVCMMVVIANGAYFGGGMSIAPEARPNDGQLDMILFGDMGKSETLKIWPMTYKGLHTRNPKVKWQKIREVVIKSEEKFLLEADGELLGEGPVSFSVLPSALTVVV